MDVRGVLQPVGPLPARVYWIRRLLPLALMVLLIAVIAVSCAGGNSSHPRTAPTDFGPTSTPTPSVPATSSTTPSPSTSASPSSSPAPCHAVDLKVVASTDSGSYSSGSTPVLKVTARNAGATPCVLTQSPSRRNWTIYSGSDLIWSTVGCPKSTIAIQTTLAPNQSVSHTLAWDRHRSGPHCTASSTTAAPGTYQLTVVFDGVRSAPAVFQLTP